MYKFYSCICFNRFSTNSYLMLTQFIFLHLLLPDFLMLITFPQD